MNSLAWALETFDSGGCGPRCQWNIDEYVLNLGSLGGADIGDLLGKMYHDRCHLCRWNDIEEPQENGQDKLATLAQ